MLTALLRPAPSRKRLCASAIQDDRIERLRFSVFIHEVQDVADLALGAPILIADHKLAIVALDHRDLTRIKALILRAFLVLRSADRTIFAKLEASLGFVLQLVANFERS